MPLLHFQTEDVEKLHAKKSRLIGNDPGTGKTYEALAMDQMNRSGRGHAKVEVPRVAKTLIICPKTVVGVWDQHCMDLTDEDVYIIDPKKRHLISRDALDKRKSGYFIVNWDALRLMPELAKVPWFHIIADEVHRAKNPKGQATRALKQLRTSYKSGLSGTPADDKPQDLWQILNWLWPNFYTNRWKFIEAYCGVETHDPVTGEEYGYRKIVGVNTERIPHLQQEMAPWFTRRLKQDVLPELPDKYYSRIYVDLLPKQRAAYNEMRKTMIAWVAAHEDEIENPVIAQAAVSQLIRLQQYASGMVVPRLTATGEHAYKWKHVGHRKAQGTPCTEKCKKVLLFDVIDPSSKLDAVMDMLEDREHDQIIVMSQFKSVINLLNARLEKKGITYGCITGDVKQDDRTAAIAEFQAGNTRVFTGTIPAMREGITLHASSTVVFIDRVWNPSWNGQAEDRAHRIGQKNAVQIIDIVARNTVDLGRHQKIAMKRMYLQQLLGDTVDLTWFKNYNVLEEYNIDYGEVS